MNTIQRIPALLAMTLIVLLSGTMVQAQHCQGHAKKGHHAEMMKEKLGLNGEQAKQIEGIHDKYAAQIKALWQDEGIDKDARLAKMRSIMDAKHAEIKTVLTPEQQAKAQEIHAQHGKGMRGHHGQRRHGEMGHGHKKMRHKAHKMMMKEMEPIVREQRAKFETQLSNRDKKKIEKLRTELEALRPEMKALHQQKKAARQTGETLDAAAIAQMKEKAQAMRKQKHEIMAQAIEIGQKYEAQLQKLHEEIKPQMEAAQKKVHAQMKEKMEMRKHEGGEKSADCQRRCEMSGDNAKCQGKRKGEGHHGHQMMKQHGEMGPQGHHSKMLAHFILMDPEGAFSFESDHEATDAAKSGFGDSPEAADMEIFPNPANMRNSLRYDISAAGPVRIELMTMDGRVVRVLSNEKHEAGTYTLDINVSDLSADNYFYRIVEGAQTRVKRFTVVK